MTIFFGAKHINEKSGTVLWQFDHPNALVSQQALGVLHCQENYRQRQTTVTFPFGAPVLSGFGPLVSKALTEDGA